VGETPRRLPEGWMKVETRTGRTTQKRPLVTVDTATAVVAAVGCMGRIWTVTLCPNKALTRRLSRTHGQPPSAAPSRATFSQQAEAAPLANQGMARAATRAGMLNVTPSGHGTPSTKARFVRSAFVRREPNESTFVCPFVTCIQR